MFGLALAFRLTLPAAIETALMLATAGEFAFVVFDNATRQGLIGEAASDLVLVAASLSMALLPLIGRGVALMRPRLVSTPAARGIAMTPPLESQPRAIVGGYGRVGQLIASILKEHAIPYIAVDSDPALVARYRDSEKTLYYGDLSKPEFLRACNVENASALVLTIDSPPVIEAVVRAAKALRPELVIISRARDGRDAHRLYELGVTEAVPETIEASLMLAEATLIGLGKPLGYTLTSIHERRDAFKVEFQRLVPEERTAVARRRNISRISVVEEKKARIKASAGAAGSQGRSGKVRPDSAP